MVRRKAPAGEGRFGHTAVVFLTESGTQTRRPNPQQPMAPKDA